MTLPRVAFVMPSSPATTPLPYWRQRPAARFGNIQIFRRRLEGKGIVDGEGPGGPAPPGPSGSSRRAHSLPLAGWSWPACLTISRHALAQSRHALAQRVICLSSGNSSHALPHTSHTLAHASQVVTAVGPRRLTTLAARAQKSPQSAQVPRVLWCFFSPLATMS